MQVRSLSASMSALAGLLLVVPDVVGQAPKRSEIRGTVVSAADRKPIKGARVSLEGHELTIDSDGKGRFRFPKVAAGTYVIRAEVEGYPAASSTLMLADNDRIDVEFQVGASDAVTLPDLTVTESAPRISPVADFNRRAMSGNGRFLTRDYIEKRAAANMMDLLRDVPGVRIRCGRTTTTSTRSGATGSIGERTCALAFSRHGGCGPAYFVDGIPTEPPVLYLLMPRDVEGVELYSGSSETPPELSGARAACGVVAIWTRVGRPRGQ